MSTALPSISIVIPSFNQGDYIGETLESLVTQQYPNLELFVMDGGSTDASVAVIRKYAKWLTHWESELDRGQSHAINKGFARATGTLFNWLNSDDLLEPGALNHIGELYTQHPQHRLFLGRTRFFSEAGTTRYSGPVLFPDVNITLGYGQLNQPAMYYRRDCWTATNFCREDLHLCMDLDLWLRYLIEHGQDKICSTTQTLCAFRLHDASKTMSATQQFRKEKDQLYQALFAAVESYPNEQQQRIQKAANYYHLWRADEFMLLGDTVEAKKSLNNVNFMQLAFSEKKRYIGVYRRLLFR